MRNTVLNQKQQSLIIQHSKLKLQIELVPQSCWMSNLRSSVSRKEWDTLRRQVSQKAHNLCEICGGKGLKHPVECHEVWAYDEITKIQSLASLQALCPFCHEVKHFGFAASRGNRQRALERFMKINKINENIAEEIIAAVYAQWKYRSTLEWILNTDLLKGYSVSTEDLIKKGNITII